MLALQNCEILGTLWTAQRHKQGVVLASHTTWLRSKPVLLKLKLLFFFPSVFVTSLHCLVFEIRHLTLQHKNRKYSVMSDLKWSWYAFISSICCLTAVIFFECSAFLVCVVCAVRRLVLCEELDRSSCGSVLFHGYLPPPGKNMVQKIIYG